MKCLIAIAFAILCIGYANGQVEPNLYAITERSFDDFKTRDNIISNVFEVSGNLIAGLTMNGITSFFGPGINRLLEIGSNARNALVGLPSTICTAELESKLDDNILSMEVLWSNCVEAHNAGYNAEKAVFNAVVNDAHARVQETLSVTYSGFIGKTGWIDNYSTINNGLSAIVEDHTSQWVNEIQPNLMAAYSQHSVVLQALDVALNTCINNVVATANDLAAAFDASVEVCRA